MGIKYFFKWYKDSFPNTVETLGSKTSLTNVPSKLLLLDLNGIIHTSCQKIYKYGAFEPKTLLKKSPPVFSGEKDELVFEDVVNSIDMFVGLIDPKELVLCIDGVAPISKQIQQRQRRFLSKKTSGGFDSNCISPGTTFLYNLGSHIKTSIEHKLEHKWLNIAKIHFMDANVPGEGEHKLYDFLRTNQTRIATDQFTVIIGGNDADLIMLSLLVSTLFLTNNPIYILREDLYSKLDYFMINITLLKQKLLNDSFRLKPSFKKSDFPKVVCDFVILCFLVGNDFLPQIPLFNIYDGGLDAIMGFYFQTADYISDVVPEASQSVAKGKMVLKRENLKLYFAHILNTISIQAIRHYSSRNYGYSNNLLDITLKKECTPDLLAAKHYYHVYSIHHKIKKADVQKYLDEIDWVFNYYAYGSATVDWNMYYPNQYAPSPIDFLEYYEEKKHNVCRKKTNCLPPVSEPFFQLLCILPPHSSELLPYPLNELLKNDMKTFHPAEITMDYEGKLNEWEGIPVLPPLDYTKIYSMYRKQISQCSPDEQKKNKVSKQLMISVAE